MSRSTVVGAVRLGAIAGPTTISIRREGTGRGAVLGGCSTITTDGGDAVVTAL